MRTALIFSQVHIRSAAKRKVTSGAAKRAYHARGGIKTACTYIGKGLIPRVQQSLTSLARRVISGLSSISRANAGIVFTRTPRIDRMINGPRNFSLRLAALIYIYADLAS